MPWEIEKDVMLNKWERFYKNCEKNRIYIFECCMIQNPMCETMMRFDFDIDESEKFIQSIFRKVSGLNLLLIYLKTDNVEKRIKEVGCKRGEKWLKSLTLYHEKGRFAKNRNLEGFMGYVDCLRKRQERELEIIDNLEINKKIIENPFLNWDKSIKEIKETIDLYM